MGSSFRVGQKVVFVGYPGPEVLIFKGRVIGRKSPLTIGQVYEIKDIKITDRYRTGRWAGPSLHVGFADERGPYWHHYSGFRPVVERGTETGMSILRNLLNKTDKPVEEVV